MNVQRKLWVLMDPPAICSYLEDKTFGDEKLMKMMDDSIDFKLWQGSLPHKKAGKLAHFFVG